MLHEYYIILKVLSVAVVSANLLAPEVRYVATSASKKVTLPS